MMFPSPWEIIMSWLDPALRRLFVPLFDRFDRLEYLIMASVEVLAERLDAATNKLADKLTTANELIASLRGQLDDAGQAKLDQALAILEPAVERLEGLGADAADPVPDEPVVGDVPA